MATAELTTAPNTHAEPRTWPLTLPEQSDLQETIHEKTWRTRSQVILALHDSYHQQTKNAARSMATCSDVVRFYIDPDAGHVRPWLSRCRQRLCPMCGKLRSTDVSRKLKLLVATMKDPRHLILTVKSTPLPLRVQLDNLRSSLSKLRRSTPWKTAVDGGVYVIECTHNTNTGLWHPHLHVLYDGRFFPVKQLQRLWHDITNGSEIVWLRRVDDGNAAANELSKYVSKPAHLHELADPLIREYHAATRGTRMLQAFGNCHGRNLHDDDEHEDLSPDTYAVSLNRLVWLAARGAPTPQRLVVLIAERFPTFAAYIYHAAPQLTPPVPSSQQHLRLMARLRGEAPPPPTPAGPASGPGPPGAVADRTEELNAEIFLAFTRYRQEDQADSFRQYDFP